MERPLQVGRRPASRGARREAQAFALPLATLRGFASCKCTTAGAIREVDDSEPWLLAT